MSNPTSNSPVSIPVLIAIGSGVVIAGLAGVSAVTALQRPQPVEATEPTPQVSPVDQGLQVQPPPVPTVESSPMATTAAAVPSPIPLPSVAPSPAPMPSPALTPAPDGAWLLTKRVEGYTHWNFRLVPNGKVTGYIPFETQLFSDRRRQDGWISVLCPADVCGSPTWGWVSINAVVEVKR